MRIHPKDIGLANPRILKDKKQKLKSTVPEDVIQSMVESYLDHIHLQYIHMPKYVMRAAFAYRPNATPATLGAMKNASAYLKGLPDLIVLHPSGYFLPLELKTETGKLSASQRMWREHIRTKTERSFEGARDLIDIWIRGIEQAEASDLGKFLHKFGG